VPPVVRCAIYTRESSASSPSELSSCEVQRDTCLSYVQAHALDGWVALDERFDDRGFSAASVDRPALQRLLKRADERQVDCVIIHRLDRLTRRLWDWVTLLGELARRDVTRAVVAGDLAGLATGAHRGLVFNLLAIFAELERDLINDRLRDARRARQARGSRVAGRPPFGYRPDPVTRQLVPDESAAHVVRRMFEMAAQRTRPATIALAMRALGATRAWEARTVLRLLRNPVYAGQGSPAIGASPAALVSRELFDTGFEMPRPPSASEHRTAEGDIDVIRRLAQRYGDDQIASVLNRLGRRTGKGNRWNEHRVASARKSHGIAGQARTKLDTEILSLSAAAEHAGVSDTAIRRLVEAGLLRCEQLAPYAPWEIRRADLDADPVRSIVAHLRRNGKLVLGGVRWLARTPPSREDQVK
jgi:DNA invertase Pin-like site-specific DNA recombinase